MSILVTGSAGFIGYHLTKKLLKIILKFMESITKFLL